MSWTKERPAEAGYYWRWIPGVQGPEVVQVWSWLDHLAVLYMGLDSAERLDTVDGYWLGPIEVPQSPTQEATQ